MGSTSDRRGLRWRRLRGFHDLAKVITEVTFNDGIAVSNLDQVAA